MPGDQGGPPDQQLGRAGDHGRRHADARRSRAHPIRQWRGDDGEDRAQLADEVGAKTLYIEPGSPWENGYCESFNGKLRDELLNGEIFYSLKEATDCHRAMAQALQHGQTAFIARISATCAADDEPIPDAARSGRANAIVSNRAGTKYPSGQLEVEVLRCSSGVQ